MNLLPRNGETLGFLPTRNYSFYGRPGRSGSSQLEPRSKSLLLLEINERAQTELDSQGSVPVMGTDRCNQHKGLVVYSLYLLSRGLLMVRVEDKDSMLVKKRAVFSWPPGVVVECLFPVCGLL